MMLAREHSGGIDAGPSPPEFVFVDDRRVAD